SHCADLTAWRASCIADFQDARQIVETKAHGERAANHPDAANSMLWVLAITIRRAARPEQPLAFIMAQSIGAHSCRLRQFARAQRTVFQILLCHEHDYKGWNRFQGQAQIRI